MEWAMDDFRASRILANRPNMRGISRRQFAKRNGCSDNRCTEAGHLFAQCEYVIWGTVGTMPADPSGETIPGFYECTAPCDRVHVTQRPLTPMRQLLRIVPPGAAVLDPFMGSGITGVACIQTERRFVGIELDPCISITHLSASMMHNGKACCWSIQPRRRNRRA
jgi:site-specific DNA-methyltransferase (adenine-specific)